MSPTLVLIVDGWPRATVRAEMEAGNLPGLSALAERGQHHKDLATPVPSVSIASHATILTGVMPRWHRVPAHRWRDVDGYRDYIGKDVLRVNRDLCPSVRTVFEAYDGPTFAVQSLVSRGAHRTLRIPALSSKVPLAVARRLLARDDAPLVVCWLPKGDSIGHRRGPESSKFAEEMRSVDAILSDLIEDLVHAYGHHGYRVAVVADHGQKPIAHHVNPEGLLRAAGVSDWQRLNVNRRRSPQDELLIATSGDSAAGIYPSVDFDRRGLVSIAERIVESSAVDAVVVSKVDGAVERHEFWWEGETLAIEVVAGDPVSAIGIDWIRSFVDSFVPGRSPEMLLLAGPDNDFAGRRRLGFGFGHHKGSHGGNRSVEMYVDGFSYGFSHLVPPTTVASFMSPLAPQFNPILEANGALARLTTT